MDENFLADYMPRLEFCEAFGISPRTEVRRRKRGNCASYIVIGREIYYRRSGIPEWLLELEKQQKRVNGRRSRAAA